MKLLDKIWMTIFSFINALIWVYIFFIKAGPGVSTSNLQSLFYFMSLPIFLIVLAILFINIDPNKVPSIEYQKKKTWLERFILIGMVFFVINASYLGFYLYSKSAEVANFALNNPLLVGVAFILLIVWMLNSYFDNKNLNQ